MKKPIETVLKEITRLPWSLNNPSEADDVRFETNVSYGCHAANQFPKLIEVLKKSLDEQETLLSYISKHEDLFGGLWASDCKKFISELESALESASNVEVGE